MSPPSSSFSFSLFRPFTSDTPFRRRMPHIRIATYNVYMRPSHIAAYVWQNDWKDARLEEFMTRYAHDYDVIMMQEMFTTWSSKRKARLTHLAIEAGFQYPAYPNYFCQFATSCGWVVDSGLVVLSKRRIIASTFVPFQTPGKGVDAWMQKGFQHVEIEIDMDSSSSSRRRLHVLNVHLQADYQIKDAEADNIKLKQLGELGAYITQQIHNLDFSPDSVIIVAGDMNIDLHDASMYEQMVRAITHPASDVDATASPVYLSNALDRLSDSGADARTAVTLRVTYDRDTQQEISTSPVEIEIQDDIHPTTMGGVLARGTPARFQQAKAVDHIFLYDCRCGCGRNRARIVDAAIQPFPSSIRDNLLQHCSDHFGVSCTVSL